MLHALAFCVSALLAAFAIFGTIYVLSTLGSLLFGDLFSPPEEYEHLRDEGYSKPKRKPLPYSIFDATQPEKLHNNLYDGEIIYREFEDEQ